MTEQEFIKSGQEIQAWCREHSTDKLKMRYVLNIFPIIKCLDDTTLSPEQQVELIQFMQVVQYTTLMLIEQTIDKSKNPVKVTATLQDGDAMPNLVFTINKNGLTTTLTILHDDPYDDGENYDFIYSDNWSGDENIISCEYKNEYGSYEDTIDKVLEDLEQ